MWQTPTRRLDWSGFSKPEYFSAASITIHHEQHTPPVLDHPFAQRIRTLIR